jgi:hypothetical protein
MKRRTKRDLSVLVGALAIVGVVAFVNTQLGRSNLAQEFNELRKRLEEENQTENLLRFSEIRETKGSLRSGGTFTRRRCRRGTARSRWSSGSWCRWKSFAT